MKNRHVFKKFTSFAAGMAVMALLAAAVSPAAASGNQVAYNQVGIRLFDQQRITAGEPYTAPNGQQVPSSITYTDAAGGKTNYLSVRQIAELLDADIAWNAEANSVDIAASAKGGDYTVEIDPPAPDIVTEPEYGKTLGAFEEVDPSTISFLGDTSCRTGTYVKDARIQYRFTSFPGFTVKVHPEGGEYLVYTVTNNGKTEQYVTVERMEFISNNPPEAFTTVAVLPGETLIRVFRLVENSDPMQTTLRCGLMTSIDHENPADLTVSLEQYRSEK